MYSKQRNTNTSSKLADVRVGVDKGSLRLQFSTKISKKFYQKPQKYVGLGRSDNAENRIWAETIARKIQADIDYPDGGMFDPTLAKYLDVRPMLATVTQLPTAKPIPTLGGLWEDFVERKLRNKEIRQTTYRNQYRLTYEPMIKAFFELPLNEQNASQLIDSLTTRTKSLCNVKSLLGILSQMCERAMAKKVLTEDYFKEISESFKVPEKSEQLKEEEDYRAYTPQQRDLIIDTFRKHEKKQYRQYADLIEFLFLTGFRPSEAIALKWDAIKFDTGWIYVNETYDSKTRISIKNTKTGRYRIFRMKGINRLVNLLKKLYENNRDSNELVFKNPMGKEINWGSVQRAWYGKSFEQRNGERGFCVGVVTKLANEGLLPYLKPYATRHTFISIQANNGADLGILADSCGNSVTVIMKHYLQIDKDKMLKDI